jgi:type I restriction enzyme S subunit
MRITIDQAKSDPRYLYLNIVFNAAIREQVRRSVNAGGREVANTATLERLMFPWPYLEEQQRIIESVESLQAIIDQERTYANSLSNVKHGLMQDLLTGRVRVKVQQEH